MKSLGPTVVNLSWIFVERVSQRHLFGRNALLWIALKKNPKN